MRVGVRVSVSVVRVRVRVRQALKAADSRCSLSAGLRCSVTALSRVPA